MTLDDYAEAVCFPLLSQSSKTTGQVIGDDGEQNNETLMREACMCKHRYKTAIEMVCSQFSW